MADNLPLWIGFNVIVVGMLVLDLGVLHRHAHKVSVKEAAIWSGVWIALSIAFGIVVYVLKGSEAGLQFFSGYLIEKALSVDNIFIFVMIFTYFQVPSRYQHRVLFWGILGALLMRGVMIFVGAALIERFQWIMYIFGVFLVFTGIRMATHSNEERDMANNTVVRLARRFLPVSDHFAGQAFLTRQAGRLVATPLLLVLLVVETTDLLFATDSIPAIFAITQDTFIVYTSNVFAILGLRALYFLVAGLVMRLRHLQYGLSAILVFVGIKMLISDIVHVPTALSLAFIVCTLAVVVVTSLISERRSAAREALASAEKSDASS